MYKITELGEMFRDKITFTEKGFEKWDKRPLEMEEKGH